MLTEQCYVVYFRFLEMRDTCFEFVINASRQGKYEDKIELKVNFQILQY